MFDPVMITILVTTVFSSAAQILQMYLDYKKAQAQGHSYAKHFESNCCSINQKNIDNDE